jgi:nicotinamide mononucleotide adenylyltransferase
MALKRDMSVRWLIPDPVIDYITKNNLYQSDDSDKEKAAAVADKGKAPESSASASAS